MHTPDAAALALAGLIGGDPDAPSRAAGAERGWAGIAALAARHRLAPLLYRRLLAAPPHVAPDPESLAALRRAYLHTLAVNERARTELTLLAATMASRGAPPLLLKGAHLAFGVYADPATRPMSDLDLLVAPARVAEAAAAIEAVGYVPVTAYSIDAERAHSAHLPAFVAPGRLPVELHWSLLRPAHACRPDVAALIRRGRPFPAFGEAARVLDPADAFLHLALHAIVKDGLDGGLRAAADMATLIAATAHDPSWRESPERARAAGAERVHDLALALVRRLLPGLLPDPLPLTPASGAPEPPVLELALDLALEPPDDDAAVTPNLAGLFAAGPGEAVRRIVQRALPSRSEMGVLDPGAGRGGPALLRYPRRWVTLVARHGPAFWRLLRGDEGARRRAERIRRGRALAGWCAGSS